MANSKATVKISCQQRAKYEGIASLHVMVVGSRDVGKLQAHL